MTKAIVPPPGWVNLFPVFCLLFTDKQARLDQDGQPQLTMKICYYGYVRFVPVAIFR